jgi:CIC family chloride channel protein
MPIKAVVQKALKKIKRDHLLGLSLLSIVTGLLGGLASIVFIEGIREVQRLGFGASSEYLASYVSQLPWFHILLVPTIGGLVVGLLSYFWMPERRGQGVAEVIESNAIKGGRMSFRNGIKAALVSIVSIGSGASVGREGPMVHLGATIGSALAARVTRDPKQSRTLLGCGVASAVAASFNAPLAGVFFALEVVVGHYGLSAFAPVVMAAVSGTLVSQLYFGNSPAFDIPSHVIATPLEFPAFILLGLGAIPVALALIHGPSLVCKVANKTGLPLWIRPAVAGLITGIVAIWLPEILSVGYEATNKALYAQLGFLTMITLLCAKVSLTSLCLGMGFGGGVFSPALFAGAMLGGTFGILATSIVDLSTSHLAVYSLVGMGAVAAAVLGAPISTTLMIFELTGDYSVTTGVMIAVALSSFVIRAVSPYSFFTLTLFQRGVEVKNGLDVSVLRDTAVGDIIDRRVDRIEKDATHDDVRRKLLASQWGRIFVVEDEILLGVIRFSEQLDGEDESLQTAGAIAEKMAFLYPDSNLEEAMAIIRRTGEAHIPVVSREDKKLVGQIHEHEVNFTYHRAILQAADESDEDDEYQSSRR